MMTRGLFGLLFCTFSGSVSAIHPHRGWTGSSVMGKLKKDALPGRRTQSASEAYCNDDKSIYEDESTTCNCQAEVDGTGTTSLNCIDVCDYCSDDLTTCVQYSFDGLYDENGASNDSTSSFVYTKGRNDIVTLRRDLNGDSSCQLFVNGQECESCTLNVCGHQLPSFSCTNVEADAVYDLCDDALIVPNGSVFEVLAFTTGGDEYLNGICYLPTEAPSSAPSAAISNVPSLPPTMTASPTTTTAPSGTPPVDDSGGGNTVGVVITVTSLIVLFATIVTMI
jgi:hypothetical protein